MEGDEIGMARFQLDVAVRCSACGGKLNTHQDPHVARHHMIVEPCQKCLNKWKNIARRKNAKWEQRRVKCGIQSK